MEDARNALLSSTKDDLENDSKASQSAQQSARSGGELNTGNFLSPPMDWMTVSDSEPDVHAMSSPKNVRNTQDTLGAREKQRLLDVSPDGFRNHNDKDREDHQSI